MSLGDPLLAVCIPTYKRPELLRGAVRSVIRAGREFGTPIVITDDSTDRTNEVVLRELCAEYPYICCYRNERNLGIDGNIIESMNRCPSRFGWWLGEDDWLLPDAIRTVRRVLESSNPPRFVFVNYSLVNEDYTRILKRKAIELNDDSCFPSADFLVRYGWAAGFIGGCIIDYQAWITSDVSRFMGTWFAHVGGIFSAIRNQSVYAIAEPLVWNRTGSSAAFTWSGSMLNVLQGWRRLMYLLESDYGAEVCAQAAEAFERAHGLSSITFLAYARAGGALTPELVRREILPGPHSFAYKVAARLFSRLPVAWFRTAQRAWHTVSSRPACRK